MGNKKLIIGVLCIALGVSCTVQETDLRKTENTSVFYASIEIPSKDDGTRVFVNQDFKVLWDEGDKVSIFNLKDANDEYRFTGKTGDNGGSFELAKDFSEEGVSIEHRYAVYPYSQSTSIDTKGTLSISLPAEQYYREQSFGPGANMMVAATDSKEFQFKNVCGYLVLKLYGEGVSVSSITLKGKNGEKIAGNAFVTMPVDGLPSIEMANDASTEITLSCETPVQLGATLEESTQFWFVVPPVAFDKGFRVSILETSGGSFDIETSKNITIERSHLTKMAVKEVDYISPSISIPEAIDLGLSVKWASFNLGASKPEEYGNYYAWGEIEPYYDSLDPLTWKEGKEAGYDWASYKWCMGSYNTMTKYCSNSSYGYNGFTDTKSVLDLEDDAAHENLGGNWRMPTEAEWIALQKNCTWTWTTQNGVNGRLVTGPNGNSIFLPAAGDWGKTNHDYVGSNCEYWSSSLDWDFSQGAWYVCIDSSNQDYLCNGIRFRGLSIRPVYDESSCVPQVPVPEPVDMGLSVKWASFNLGASKPEEHGDYYAWGEIDPYYSSLDPLIWKDGKEAGYEWPSYKWCMGSKDTMTKYCSISEYGYNGFTDAKTVLDPEDDAAWKAFGGRWRMPTDTEFWELHEKCIWEWTAMNDINGFKVTGPNGSSLFLPAAGSRPGRGIREAGSRGYYWSSTPNGGHFGNMMSFTSDAVSSGGSRRCSGLSIRPVYAE